MSVEMVTRRDCRKDVEMGMVCMEESCLGG